MEYEIDYTKASEYWASKEKKVADEELIRQRLNSILRKHKSCVLATSRTGEVDATPVHYVRLKETPDIFYILSEGGMKFSNLEINKNVCLSIYNNSGDFGNLHSVQAYGLASFVDVMSDEYVNVIKNSHYSQMLDYLLKRRETDTPMYLIRIHIKKYRVLDTDFMKVDKVDVHQELIVE